MHRARAVLVMLVWTLDGLGLVPGAGASQQVNHAGVIVRQADGSFVYGYVAFAEDHLDGVELLRRSGIPLVTSGFGGLGEAVCSLDGRGCGVTECRKSVCQSGPDAPYWQYFRQGEPGAWSPLLMGASGTRVRNGDIDGWSWTARDADLPAVTLADLAALAGMDGALPPNAPAVAWRRTGPDPALADAERGGSTGSYAAAGAVLAAIGAGAAVAALRRRAAEHPEREAA